MTTVTHLVLLRGDEREWEARTADEVATNTAAHERFTTLAAQRGHTIIRGDELRPVAHGKAVRRRGGTRPSPTARSARSPRSSAVCTWWPRRTSTTWLP